MNFRILKNERTENRMGISSQHQTCKKREGFLKEKGSGNVNICCLFAVTNSITIRKEDKTWRGISNEAAHLHSDHSHR